MFVFGDAKKEHLVKTEIESEESASDSSEDEHEECSNQELNESITSIVSLMALNETYADLVDHLINKTENLLAENKKKQKEIEEVIALKNRPGSTFNVCSVMFMPPYFKDDHKMIPATNEESYEIRRQTYINPLIRAAVQWKEYDLQLLERVVVVQLINAPRKRLVDRYERLKDLVREEEQRKEAANKKKIEELEKEADETKCQLRYLESHGEEFAAKATSYDDIDWAKISSRTFKGKRSPIELKAKWSNELAFKWNRSPWTPNEEKYLKAVSGATQVWDYVAMTMNTNRTSFMCFEHYQFLRRKFPPRRSWTKEEDKKLLSLMPLYTKEGEVQWKKVAQHIPDRNWTQCEVRYTRSLDPAIKKGRWSEEEDILLMASVNKYGPHNWPRIAKAISSRTEVQCRARWVDQLDSKLNKGPWSKDEDEIILMGIQAFGRSNPANIARLIPGRNSNAVKTRIKTMITWKLNKMNKKDDAKSVMKSRKPRKLDRVQKADERFNRIYKLSTQLAASQRAISFANRLGYGNYIINNSGERVDYSTVKEHLKDKLGEWCITKKGKWSRMKKNPNEFDEKKTASIINALPPKKRNTLKEFLSERANRLAQARDLSEEEKAAQEAEQEIRVENLIDTVLEFTQKELDSRVNKGSADKKVSEAEASVTEDYIDVVDQEDDIDVVGHESDMDVVGHEASDDAGKNHLTGNAFTVGRRRRAADPEEQIEKPKKVAALSLGTRT